MTKFLWSIFLCGSKSVRKSRKEIRAEWSQRQEKSDLFSSGSDSSLKEESLLEVTSVTKIQSVVRGYLGRIRAKRKWKEKLKEADEYWMFVIWMKEEEERIRKLRAAARRQFVEVYTKDIVETSIEFIIQASKATVTIQRTWRGHRCRMRLPRMKIIRKKRMKPREIKGRHSNDTLRRVWARTLFEPKNSTYLHCTDFGYLEYDMWEYVDKFPEGRDKGLVTRKVKATVNSDKQQYILKHDRHAWVGLPVGFETEAEANRKRTLPSVSQKSITFNNPLQKRKVPQWMKEFIMKLRKRNYKLERIPSVQLRALVALGYNPDEEKQFLKGADRENSVNNPKSNYRIGALTYDPYSGYLLIHRGEGRWTKLSTGEDITLMKSSIVDAEKLPINAPNILSMIGEDDKIHVTPTIKNLKSGLISIKNPEVLSEDSFHIYNHKSFFTEKYIKNNPNFLGEKFLTNNKSPRKVTSNNDDQSLSSWISNGNFTSTSPTKSKVDNSVFLMNEKSGENTQVRGTRKVPILLKQLEGNSVAMADTVKSGSRYSTAVRDTVKDLSIDDPNSWINTIGAPLDSMDIDSNEAWLDLVKSKLNETKSFSLPDVSMSDEEIDKDVWSRSIYKPKKEQVAKVVVWPKKAKRHYSFLYNWIPQPLVHNAVNNLFYEKTYKDFRNESLAIFSRKIKEEILNESDQRKQMMTSTSLITALDTVSQTARTGFEYAALYQTEASDLMSNVNRSASKKQMLAINEEDEFNFENSPSGIKNYASISNSLYPNTVANNGYSVIQDDNYHYYYDDNEGNSNAIDDNSSFASSVEANTLQHPLRQRPIDIVTVKYPDLRKKERNEPVQTDESSSVSSLHSHELSSIVSIPVKIKGQPSKYAGNLLDTSSVNNSQQSFSLRSKIPPPFKSEISALNKSHDFSAFLESADYPGTIPDLTSTLDISRSTDNKVIYQNKEKHRKFHFPQKTPGAKIAPMHPYNWH